MTQGEENEDRLYWKDSTSRKFTIRSALKLIKGNIENSPQDEEKWKIAWGIKVPQRVKMFIWLTLLGKNLTNANRRARHLTDDPRCTIYGTDEETMEHILRNCNLALKFWNELGLKQDPKFMLTPFNQWIIEKLDPRSPDKNEKWLTAFAMAIWWLWRWRCCKIFDKSEEIPEKPVDFVRFRVTEIERAMENGELCPDCCKPSRIEVYLQWVAPPEAWHLLNTDGAAKGNPGPAGVAESFGIQMGRW